MSDLETDPPRDHNGTGSKVVRSLVAIGDSFTEGLDDMASDGEFRGFADRLAQHLAQQYPGFRYANLAVRGRRMRQICGEQVDQTLSLAPDLVTVHAGGNDVLRPNTNLDQLAAQFDAGICKLRAAGIRVVILSGHDTGWIPVLRAYRGRIAVYSMHLRAIAERHGCDIVDMWAMSALNDARAWSVDRLHFNAAGHSIVAARTAEVVDQPMGGPELWQSPWNAPAVVPPPAVRRRQTLRWTYQYLVPWIGRRAMGRSSGDGLAPKRPELTELATASASRDDSSDSAAASRGVEEPASNRAMPDQQGRRSPRRGAMAPQSGRG